MSKEIDGITVNFNFDSLNVQFGDTNSTSFYNSDMTEALEMDLADDGEESEETATEDTCECDSCKDEKKSAEDKHDAKAPECEKDFFRTLIESILADMK